MQICDRESRHHNNKYMADCCAVCLDRVADTVLFPCAHMVLCKDCADRFTCAVITTTCPACRCRIEAVVEFKTPPFPWVDDSAPSAGIRDAINAELRGELARELLRRLVLGWGVRNGQPLTPKTAVAAVVVMFRWLAVCVLSEDVPEAMLPGTELVWTLARALPAKTATMLAKLGLDATRLPTGLPRLDDVMYVLRAEDATRVWADARALFGPCDEYDHEAAQADADTRPFWLSESALDACGEMPISVRTLTGKTLTYSVRPETTVLRLKQMIHTTETYPPHMHKILFAGKQLQDDMTLRAYNICRGATLYLIISFGRMFDPRD